MVFLRMVLFTVAVFQLLPPGRIANADCNGGTEDVSIRIRYDRTNPIHVSLLRDAVERIRNGYPPMIPSPPHMTVSQLEAEYLAFQRCVVITGSNSYTFARCRHIVVIAFATFPRQLFCVTGITLSITDAYPGTIRSVALDAEL